MRVLQEERTDPRMEWSTCDGIILFPMLSATGELLTKSCAFLLLTDSDKIKALGIQIPMLAYVTRSGVRDIVSEAIKRFDELAVVVKNGDMFPKPISFMKEATA
jgi:hypothetical protein